jgi:hypothetical protein
MNLLVLGARLVTLDLVHLLAEVFIGVVSVPSETVGIPQGRLQRVVAHVRNYLDKPLEFTTFDELQCEYSRSLVPGALDAGAASFVGRLRFTSAQS